MTSVRVVSDLMLPLWEEVLWPFLDAWDSVRLRTTSAQWHVPRRYGRALLPLWRKSQWFSMSWFGWEPSIRLHGVVLFSLFQKKPAFVPGSEAFKSFIGDGFPVPELKGGGEATAGAMRRCMSLDHMDLVTKSLATCKIGRWQR